MTNWLTKKSLTYASLSVATLALLSQVESPEARASKGRPPNMISKLLYILDSKDAKISLDLFEAENYAAAVVVQPLVGNLVYYSNQGLYEPRLAASWKRDKPNVWSFELRTGLKCENGEEITAASFKKSLERIILSLKKKGGSPVLKDLTGYREFVAGNPLLPGIEANGNSLRFVFDRPVRSGLIQILSFAPYGYISQANLNPDGSWKDRTKFVSSGPYKVKSIDIGSKYVLEKRDEWKTLTSPTSPQEVEIVLKTPSEIPADLPVIFDTTQEPEKAPKNLGAYRMVPEYLNSILLGNFGNGPFKNADIRKAFKLAIVSEREKLPTSFGAHLKADSFFPNGEPFNTKPVKKKSKLRGLKIVIEGSEPSESSFKITSWTILKKVCLDNGMTCEFAKNIANWENLRSQTYDIRLRGTSVGGAAEGWTVDSLFCSMMGPNLPNPSGSICKLLDSYNSEAIGDEELSTEFNKIVESDDAIIPISHFGNQFFMSDSIDRRSLSPSLVVIRFDHVDLK